MPNAKIARWPTPWSLDPDAERNFVDANGKYIGCCFVDAASALVVEAVNARNGNAAALREALVRLDEHLHEDMYDYHLFFDLFDYDPKEEISDALAEPARNVDRFQTKLDALLAWKREKHCIGDFVEWLFATVEDSAQ